MRAVMSDLIMQEYLLRLDKALEMYWVLRRYGLLFVN